MRISRKQRSSRNTPATPPTPASNPPSSYPACWIGVDVSKDSLQIDAYPTPARLQASNDPAGIARLLEHLRPLRVEGIVLEATGGYERAVVRALQQAGYAVSVINPQRARHFAK